MENSADNSFALKNLVSGKYINGNANPLTLGTAPTAYKYSFNPSYQDFTLATAENKALFPVSANYSTNPGCIYVDGVRPQGAAWKMDKVWQVKYECVDADGNTLGTYGEDWFLHFQDKHAYGRVVHLQPAKWVNDWLVIGDDKDGDGCGNFCQGMLR